MISDEDVDKRVRIDRRRNVFDAAAAAEAAMDSTDKGIWSES